tara:strand:+ start:1767 stop:2144 length:378 start_codon:yes stop_codon:yes gene_type:complete
MLIPVNKTQETQMIRKEIKMDIEGGIRTKDKEGNELNYRRIKVTGSADSPNVFLNLVNLEKNPTGPLGRTVKIKMKDQHNSNGNGGTLKILTDVEIDGTVTRVELAQFFSKEELKQLAFEIIRTF